MLARLRRAERGIRNAEFGPNADDDGELDERLYLAPDADVNCPRMLPIRARQCTTIAFRMSSTRALSRKRMPDSVICWGLTHRRTMFDPATAALLSVTTVMPSARRIPGSPIVNPPNPRQSIPPENARNLAAARGLILSGNRP